MKPTSSIGIEQARAQLPSLVAQAHEGHISVLTRHGRPYAAIVPLSLAAPPSRGAGLLQLRGTGRGLWRPSARRVVETLRSEWE